MASLSIIIPVFNEEENIKPVASEIDLHVKEDYELIFVDDGSTDGTYYAIEEQSIRDHRVKCISLSRNFGHQNALVCGMQHACGDHIILMDGDLQHPASSIPGILQKLEEGFDLVHTKRQQTANISFLKKWMAGIFYFFINRISDIRIEPNVADFRGFNRKVLDAVLRFSERELFLRGIFSWIGFKTAILVFDAPARKFGKTKYSFRKMLLLALKGTTSFSFKPLRIALLLGSIISLAAFGFGVYALIVYYQGYTVPGWTSLIIAVMFFGGTQLLALGLLGEYIASLFTETKQRPVFLVNKTINF